MLLRSALIGCIACAVALSAISLPLSAAALHSEAETYIPNRLVFLSSTDMGALVLAQADQNPRDAVQSGDALPLAQILPSIQQKYPGELLDATLNSGNPPVYLLKILMSNGRVVMVSADATSGRIIQVL